MKTLGKSIEEFSFIEREKEDGKPLKFKCGRDFLYYALNFYLPQEFNRSKNNPQEIDRLALFGLPMPPHFAWTQIQFANIAKLLNKYNLRLYINDIEIKGYFSMVYGILFSRKSYKTAIADIETAINMGEATGIDISLGMYGLVDHVLFVYGYDDLNLFVFDSHHVPILEYERIHPDVFYFKLPKKLIKARWTKFGRIWKIKSSRLDNRVSYDITNT